MLIGVDHMTDFSSWKFVVFFLLKILILPCFMPTCFELGMT